MKYVVVIHLFGDDSEANGEKDIYRDEDVTKEDRELLEDYARTLRNEEEITPEMEAEYEALLAKKLKTGGRAYIVNDISLLVVMEYPIW
jgi:hypothetical protein